MSRLGVASQLARAAGLLGSKMLLPVAGAAQSTASTSVSAIAYVITFAPLTVTGIADLDFGTVLAGTAATPTDLATDAGRFQVTGQPSASIALTYTLPADLGGPGGSIPVVFGTADGLLWNPYPTGFTTFDPNGPLSTALDGVGSLTVGITGTVSPPLGTTPGTYTGTITLTVSYL